MIDLNCTHPDKPQRELIRYDRQSKSTEKATGCKECVSLMAYGKEWTEIMRIRDPEGWE